MSISKEDISSRKKPYQKVGGGMNKHGKLKCYYSMLSCALRLSRFSTTINVDYF